MWGPDGSFVGRPAPAEPQPPEPTDLQRAGSRVGAGCLVLIAAVLLLPAALLGFVSVVSSLGSETAEAIGTVREIAPGVDELGRRRAYCYVVDYEVDGATHTHRTCHSTSAEELPPDETRDRLFAEQHPVGSRVSVLYEVDDPAKAFGGVADPEGFHTGSSWRLTLGAGLAALLLLAGSFFALRTAARLSRQRRA